MSYGEIFSTDEPEPWPSAEDDLEQEEDEEPEGFDEGRWEGEWYGQTEINTTESTDRKVSSDWCGHLFRTNG